MVWTHNKLIADCKIQIVLCFVGSILKGIKTIENQQSAEKTFFFVSGVEKSVLKWGESCDWDNQSD